jgi:hypothetical protein
MRSVSGGRFRQVLAACASNIQSTFLEHVPFYLTAFVFGAATLVISSAYRVPIPFDAIDSFPTLALEFLVLGILLGALAKLVRVYREGQPRDPLLLICRWMLQSIAARLGNIVHTTIPMVPLAISFYVLKDEIPALHPFSWDRTFMEWGRWLSFGDVPWRVLQPLVGYPLVTVALNLVYEAWFPVMFGCFAWQAFAPRSSAVRTQYMLAFAFCWFLAGNVLATIFSSAGPCFYGYFVSGPNPYAPQLDYLRHVSESWPVWSVGIQDALWTAYKTGHGQISGISAMPSMHVTIATLMALLGWRVSRRAGIFFTAFAGLIFVGSIALAWHYAVDGLAGIVLAIAFWLAAGKITAAWTAYCARPVRMRPLVGAPVLE